MSLSRNVTVKIIKNKARLDSKLYFYEKDYDAGNKEAMLLLQQSKLRDTLKASSIS